MCVVQHTGLLCGFYSYVIILQDVHVHTIDSVLSHCLLVYLFCKGAVHTWKYLASAAGFPIITRCIFFFLHVALNAHTEKQVYAKQDNDNWKTHLVIMHSHLTSVWIVRFSYFFC